MNENEEPLSKITRLDVCMFMHQNCFEFTDQPNQQTAVLHFILEQQKLSIQEIKGSTMTDLRTSVRNFVNNLIILYKASSKHFSRLIKLKILEKDLPDSLITSLKSAVSTRAQYVRKIQKKAFLEKSIRSQYLEAQKLRESCDPGVINLAAGQNLTKAGKKDARFVLEKVSSATGLTAIKARAAISRSKAKEAQKITPGCALGFLLNQNLTRVQYQAIRAISKDKGADIWPSYKEIQSAKLDCRPEEIEVSDHSAFVPLQQLLD